MDFRRALPGGKPAATRAGAPKSLRLPRHLSARELGAGKRGMQPLARNLDPSHSREIAPRGERRRAEAREHVQPGLWLGPSGAAKAWARRVAAGLASRGGTASARLSPRLRDLASAVGAGGTRLC